MSGPGDRRPVHPVLQHQLTPEEKRGPAGIGFPQTRGNRLSTAWCNYNTVHSSCSAKDQFIVLDIKRCKPVRLSDHLRTTTLRITVTGFTLRGSEMRLAFGGRGKDVRCSLQENQQEETSGHVGAYSSPWQLGGASDSWDWKLGARHLTPCESMHGIFCWRVC